MQARFHIDAAALVVRREPLTVIVRMAATGVDADPIHPAHGHRAIAAAALLATAGLGLLTPHAQAEKRPYRLQRTDCVITSDSSCVGPNAKATMVLPKQQTGPIAKVGPDGQPSGLPAGLAAAHRACAPTAALSMLL
ncbi:hypothetical protein [Sphaerotilus mobilis]|uniref:hypothetical protein n=1 Tax=Sphaerotilus mobilis TaxID=47994 RepID=UPI0013EEB8D7|nr:hypothetical protein [Sphaerotilus mobilis]